MKQATSKVRTRQPFVRCVDSSVRSWERAEGSSRLLRDPGPHQGSPADGLEFAFARVWNLGWADPKAHSSRPLAPQEWAGEQAVADDGNKGLSPVGHFQ